MELCTCICNYYACLCTAMKTVSEHQDNDKLDDDDDYYDYVDCDDIVDSGYVINKLQPIKQETYLQG